MNEYEPLMDKCASKAILCPQIAILSVMTLKPIHQNSAWIFIMSDLKSVIFLHTLLHCQ